MGCFVLNGTADASYMLQLVMTPELISDALVMMVVDLSRPWLIMDSLEKCVRNASSSSVTRIKPTKNRADSMPQHTQHTRTSVSVL